MNAANQKIMVRNSTAPIANLWAARGKREGERARYATARIVQTEVKSIKLRLCGDQLAHGLVKLLTTKARLEM